MGQKGEGLAARLKATLAGSAAADDAVRQAQSVAAAEARAAREALFDDLTQFAAATGFLDASRSDAGMALAWQGKRVAFDRDGDADLVRIHYATQREGTSHALYREPMLGNRWVWRYRRGAREDRVPLFDQGLELLLVDALGLPKPDPHPQPAGGASSPAAAGATAESQAPRSPNVDRKRTL